MWEDNIKMHLESWGGAHSVVTKLWAGRFRVRFLAGARHLLVSKMLSPVLVSAQPLVQ